MRSGPTPIRPNSGRFRILYHYGSQQYDTGSPRALAGMIDLVDRSTFQPVYFATAEGPLVRALEERGVEIVRGRTSLLSVRRPLAAISRIRQQAATIRSLNIDLVHVNDFGWDLDLVLGAWAARIPVILHLHNPFSVEFRNLNRFAASRVFLVSHALASEVQNFERIKHKAEILYNSIDLDKFGPPEARQAAEGQPIVVGTVAQLCHRKGIDLLVQTARMVLPRNPRVEFHVIGRAGVGEEGYASALVAAADEAIMNGRLKFLGARSDVAGLLKHMHIFFFPSRAECCPIALLEAMAAALPVVASGIAPHKEIISRPEIGVTVSSQSPVDYADALISLAGGPDIRLRMGARARASLFGRFDKATVADRLNKLYRSCLSATGVRPTLGARTKDLE